MQNLAAGLRSMGKGTFKGIAALALAGPALVLALPSIPFLLFMGMVPLAMLGSNFQMLATGLRSLGKGTFKGIAALAIAGPALFMALPSIPFLLAMGLIPLAMLAKNFDYLGKGLRGLGKGFSSIMKGLLVLGLLGIAIIPAALAFSLLDGINPGAMLAFSLSLAILGATAAGLGFIFPMVLLGSLALAALGLAIIPAAMAFGQLGNTDPAAMMGFGVGLGLIGAAVAGMGYLLPFILLGVLSAHALTYAIEPAVKALSGLGGVDSNSIIGFGIGLGLVGASVAGIGMFLPNILLGVVGLAAIAIALPHYARALQLIPGDVNMMDFAAGTLALGLAGIVLIPGAVGFVLMAGAIAIFAGSLLLLLPLLPVMAALGAFGGSGIGGKGSGSGEGKEKEEKSNDNAGIEQKLDQLIALVADGGDVIMDGKKVGKVINAMQGLGGS